MTHKNTLNISVTTKRALKRGGWGVYAEKHNIATDSEAFEEYLRQTNWAQNASPAVAFCDCRVIVRTDGKITCIRNGLGQVLDTLDDSDTALDEAMVKRDDAKAA